MDTFIVINLYPKNVYISLIPPQYDLIPPEIQIPNHKNILFPRPLNLSLCPFSWYTCVSVFALTTSMLGSLRYHRPLVAFDLPSPFLQRDLGSRLRTRTVTELKSEDRRSSHSFFGNDTNRWVKYHYTVSLVSFDCV